MFPSSIMEIILVHLLYGAVETHEAKPVIGTGMSYALICIIYYNNVSFMPPIPISFLFFFLSAYDSHAASGSNVISTDTWITLLSLFFHSDIL